MKLIRFGDNGREVPGVLLADGRRLDASGEFHDYHEGYLLATGAPSGVAMGLIPPRFLQAGDWVQCGVARLGELAQRVVASHGS